MRPRILFPKPSWKNAFGASSKARRLHLQADQEGLFTCPLINCDSTPFYSKRGCRKHVYTKHGCYYYFDKKPDILIVMPNAYVYKGQIQKQKRSATNSMPSFSKHCKIAVAFRKWISSPGGGGKSVSQSEQLCSKVLKYLKFSCDDIKEDAEIPESVVDYCLGSINLLSHFVEYLQNTWKVGYAGSIGYMNAISHMIDY